MPATWLQRCVVAPGAVPHTPRPRRTAPWRLAVVAAVAALAVVAPTAGAAADPRTPAGVGGDVAASNQHCHTTCNPQWGRCYQGRCLCYRFRLTRDSAIPCGVDYRDLVPGAYTPYVAACISIHSIAVLFTLGTFPLPHRWFGQPRQVFNQRHVAAVCNFVGSVLRIVWLTTPPPSHTLFTRVSDAILLRLPQLLWIGCVLLLLLVWTDITKAVTNTSSRPHLIIAVVIFAVAATSLPVTIANAYFWPVDPVFETGGTVEVTVRYLLGAALVLMCAWAVVSAKKLLAITSFFESRAEVTVFSRSRLRKAVRNIIITSTTMVAGAGVLLVMIAVMSSTKTTPSHHPFIFFSYLVMIHCGVEGGAAVVLAYSCAQPVRLTYTRQPSVTERSLLVQRGGHARTVSGAGLSDFEADRHHADGTDTGTYYDGTDTGTYLDDEDRTTAVFSDDEGTSARSVFSLQAEHAVAVARSGALG